MLQVLCDLHIVHEQESKILKYITVFYIWTFKKQ